MAQPESIIQNNIILELGKRGYLAFRNDTGGYKDQKSGRWILYGLCKGSSDIVAVAPGGRAVFIEVKTATGRIRPEQVQFIKAVRAVGALAGVARSVEDALRICAGEILD